MSVDEITRNKIVREVIDGQLEVVFNRENGQASDITTIQIKSKNARPDATGNTYDLAEIQKRYGSDIVERLTHARAICTLRCKIRFEEAALCKLHDKSEESEKTVNNDELLVTDGEIGGSSVEDPKSELPLGDQTEAQLDLYLKAHGVTDVRWSKVHSLWSSRMEQDVEHPFNLHDEVLRFPDGCDALEVKLIMVTKLKEIRRNHRERITNKLREARKAEVQRRSPVTKTVDRAAREAILRVDERFARRSPATETIERLTREVILRHAKETEALIGRRLAAAVFGDDKLASPEIKEAIFAAVKEIVIAAG